MLDSCGVVVVDFIKMCTNYNWILFSHQEHVEAVLEHAQPMFHGKSMHIVECSKEWPCGWGD